MKIIGIFNKREEQIGFRLGGMETNLIQNKNELEEKLADIMQSTDVGILVISKEIFDLLPQRFEKIQKGQIPLLLRID